jgi:hypothetical protein
MFCRTVWRAKAGALGAIAALFFGAALQAGDRVHSGDRLAAGAPPAPVAARIVSVRTAVSVLVTLPATPAAETFRVNLRGPDGLVRQFPVAGGRAAIQFRQVFLRPGESLAIRWTPVK